MNIIMKEIMIEKKCLCKDLYKDFILYYFYIYV